MASKVGLGLLRWLLVLTSLTLFFPCGLSLHAEPRSFSNLLALRDVPVNTTGSPNAPPRLRNATAADLEKARAVVKAALSEAAVRNKARLDHPRRNRYTLRPGTQPAGTSPVMRFTSASNETASESPPLLEITQEIADAAALLAEADAYANVNRSTPTPTVRKRAGYWMEDISRKGSWPFKKDDSYQVFRNVKDFGAVGDGVTDDTAAIRSAINSTRSRRCAEGCNGSTLHNAVVYFPSGTYLVSSTIYALFGTQMIGNPNDPPVIKGAPSFVGLGVFSTDEYVPNGGTGPDGNAKEWYINTANFYRQIRNFKFDITQTDPNAYICAIHYQVAQATSLSNVEFNVGAPPTTQQAIFAENGSGGVMSDLTFNGGNFGIYGGSQQFTAQRLKFRNCATAVQLIWDWGWTWKSIDISGCTTGFKLVSEDGVHHTGSILLLDSKFTNTGTAILTFPATKELAKGTTGITLDNVAFDNVQNPVVDTEGKVYLSASVGSVDTWVLGPIYSDGRVRGDSLSMTFTTDREKSLLGSSSSGLPKLPFFERARPQYENEGAASFVHMKDYARGDGSTDDTAAFQKALDNNGSKIIFVNAGSYILTDTITIPAGARIVGEAWSQLVASGNNFGDASNPRPLVRVGKPGDVGSVEIQDLLFTSKGPTPGAVFVEWNIKASSPGAAAMWDSHVRLGGAEGTELTSKQCPPSTSGTNSGCNVGSLMMHVTPGSSALLDNVWLWLADHDIDDPSWEDDNNNMVQMSVYVARGLLVESTDATWLYGTSSEHAVMYQYNFWKARNVFAGMIQTESPYYQPTPKPPAPFADTVGKFAGDWGYDCQNSGASGCDASWALLVRNSTDLFIAGAGLYSWFTTYTQDCVDTMNCQQSLVLVQDNFEHVRIHNLITIGATNMIESDGYKIKSADNLAVDFHPYWSQISVFDPIQNEPDPCEGRLTEPNGDDPQQTDGRYPPALPVGTNLPALPHRNYLSIVNGSPYNFKLTSTHTNQMTEWEWHDIPAGESRQNMFEYRATSYAVDDKGEAYYEIEGTGKTFVVLIRTDYDNDGDHFLAKIDYRGLSTNDAAEGTIYPIYTSGGGHGIEWVLTGSEDYGYWSSYNPPEAWMHSILDVIGDRKLKHVCMPGSHDAGIYQIGSTAGGASAGNCQTQGITILDQMRRGSRYFDIRPVLGDGGKYLMGHYSTASLKVGCNGGSLDDLVSDTNKFLASNDELVILYLSHAYDTDNPSYPAFTDAQWNGALDVLEKIEKKCANLNKQDLTEVTMNEYIGKGGCALIITEGGTERPSKGIYRSGRFPRKDDFSETNDPEYMADDQIAKLQRNRNIRDPASPANADTFFVLSWTLTQDIFDVIFQTITGYARLAQDTLYWKAYSAFTPFSYPNVLYVDYYGGVRATDYNSAHSHLAAMAMAVNLRIASQNCYVGGGKIVNSD